MWSDKIKQQKIMARGLPSAYSVSLSSSTKDINQAPSTPHLTRSRCIYIVDWLYKIPLALNFRIPVSVSMDERAYAYYLHIIHEPMDLTSVDSYLQFSEDDEFVFEEFLRRMRLIWKNSYTFNGHAEAHYVSLCAQRLQRLFETKVIKSQRHSIPDDDSQKLNNVFLPLLLSLSDFNSDYFSEPRNHTDEGLIELHNYPGLPPMPLYYEKIHKPLYYKNIIEDLENDIYVNRYDISDDVYHVLENARKFYIELGSGRHEYRIEADDTIPLAKRLFANTYEDVDSKFTIFPSQREQLHHNICDLGYEDREHILLQAEEVCPESVQETVSGKDLIINRMNMRTFIILDTLARELTAKSLPNCTSYS